MVAQFSTGILAHFSISIYTKSEIKELFLHSVLDKMFVTIDRNFSHLFSERRIRLIKDCLEYRYNEINKLLI